MSDPTSVNDQNDPTRQLMGRLAREINAAGLEHGAVLNALLHLYASVLLHFPCCWDAAAEALARLLTKVQELQAAQQAHAQQLADQAIAKAAGHSH